MIKVFKTAIISFTLLFLAGCATSTDQIISKERANATTLDTQSPAKASLDKLKEAAQAGDPDAEYALGYRYYYGKGVPQDEETAFLWINKAATQGQPQAIKAVQLLKGVKHPQSGRVEGAVTTQAADTAPSASKPIVPAAKKALAPHQTQFMQVPKNYYTIQLLGSYDKRELERFVAKYHLQRKAHYYHTYHDRKTWYVLTYGLYSTMSQARIGLRALPAEVKRHKPWITPVSEVQTRIEKRG